jgi:hypothetical protein
MVREIVATPRNQGWAFACIECVRADAALHCFVMVYALVGLLVGIAAGVPHKFVPLSYLNMGAEAFRQLFLLVLASAGLWSLRSPSPLRALRINLWTGLVAPQAVAGLFLFASLLLFMGVFTSIKTMLPDIVPFFADPFLADLDQLLHGRDPWLYATALLRPDFTITLERLYFVLWGLLLPGALLAALMVPMLREVRAQFVWTIMLAWPLLGNVIAAAAMSAGPVYYELVTGYPRFAGLVDYLARHSMAQEWQALLWKAHVAGQAGPGYGVSAFPSLHLANATLFVLLAGRVHRWLKWTAVAFCAVILFGSVHLGWHYAVDGYFAIAGTVLIWKIVGWATRERRPFPPQSHEPPLHAHGGVQDWAAPASQGPD